MALPGSPFSLCSWRATSNFLKSLSASRRRGREAMSSSVKLPPSTRDAPSGTLGASLLMVLATVELGTLINSSLEKKGESHVSRTSIVCPAAADPCVLPWRAKLQCRSETWLLPAGFS